MTASSDTVSVIGGLYITIGVIGFLCNGATVFMIIMKRVFRLSAYTIMANVALADAIMMIVAGIACGMGILWSDSNCNIIDANGISMENISSKNMTSTTYAFLSLSYKTGTNCSFLSFCLAFFEIAAWTAGVVSYAYLGLNRCVAICFYGTKAKTFNRVTVALIASVSTWIIGIAAACVGTFPAPLVGNRTEMWSVSFLSTEGKRPGK
uniref:G-protein coupled receptors family 1 profile domain-containing protein n=1 Tax=Panagrolaimus superbus TaxID=310955 RepID=A0A914XXE0_9BILA